MQNKQVKSLNKRISEVVELINLIEVNFEICKEIQTANKIKNKHPSDVKSQFLILISNNAFNCAVENLHTLLCSTKEKDIKIRLLLEEKIKTEEEISYNSNDKKNANKLYNSLLQDYPNVDFDYNFLKQTDRPIGDELARFKKIKRHDDLLEIIDDLKKDFENNDFHKIRHQSIAHKNINLKYPAGAGGLLIKPIYIKELSEIVKKVKIVSCVGFDYELKNHRLNIVNYLEKFLRQNKYI